METTSAGFSRELLFRPWPDRLDYFRAYTMAHPRLLAARETLLGAIHGLAPNSLILVLGPTGVGKTTLRFNVEQTITTDTLPDLRADPGRLPVISVECIAPESGSFNWRDHFHRLLIQIDEPLADRKRNLEAPDPTQPVLRFMPSTKAACSAYRHAAEQAIRFRQPAAVLLDEAQHLGRVGSGRRLSDQLDVIKSMANRTGTLHVLFGTYELLAFRNLSAQLSRRSIDIHFPRYRVDNRKDREVFLNVLRSFEQQMPLAEPPNLLQEWEYLYERSIGCVGVLKDWLVRSLAAAIRRKYSALTLQDLRANALSASQCEKMLAETLEGEVGLAEGEEQSSRLRTRLGLSIGDQRGELPEAQSRTSSTVHLPQRRRRRPGQRLPIRDMVGEINACSAAV